MRYLTFNNAEEEQYKIAVLVPKLDKAAIEKYYIDPYQIPTDSVIAFTLRQTKKKTPAKDQKEYLAELLPCLQDLKVEYLIVTDAEYFKTITKAPKADANLGYVMEASCDVAVRLGYTPRVVYCPNFSTVFYDPPKVTAKIQQAMQALVCHMTDTYQAPGNGVIHMGAYPHTVQDIQVWLQRLLDMDCNLSCDIEAFSLKHYDAGIGTITFCWNQHEGISFPVDYSALPCKDEDGNHGVCIPNEPVRELLRQFFTMFSRKMIYHNISFDVTVLVYQLFMKHILDTEGLLHGLDILLRNWDCTKLITYLATNSCAGNKLGLKDQSQEFAGNYAKEEIKDIRRIPLDELLQYNLIDGLSTWYVYNKWWATLVEDQQEDIYLNLFKPAILDIVQMQLTGLPVDREEVTHARDTLQADWDAAVAKMASNPIIQQYELYRLEAYTNQKNSEWVSKRMTVAEMAAQAKVHEPTRKEIAFNPNSDPQVRHLLYDLLGLPLIDLTDTKLGSTGKDTLKKLINHTDEPEVKSLLAALIDFTNVAIILNTFIPAFERAVQGPDGWHYLFGNFNLGGTLSGRLSSNDPNLQNIPATGSKYAKTIKKCIKAPPGYLFVGLDFSSLEDRISALTTKDPNKLKVYTDGYDGHSLRAFSYYREQMPDIEDTVESINSIENKYKPLRQESKPPTFALTYQGTYITLMNNCGFSMEKAKMIEERFQKLYVISIQWVASKLDEASKTGFVTAAFGLRVRTPLLKQVIRGTRKTPYEAQAEGRTAGNALGQSWCLLNTRAGSEFMGKVRASKYRLSIRPCAQIHDAQYYLLPDDMATFRYLNEHLVIAAKWQDHPEIHHDQVKLGGTSSIFYPNWAYEMSIKNDASEEDIELSIQKHITELQKEHVL